MEISIGFEHPFNTNIYVPNNGEEFDTQLEMRQILYSTFNNKYLAAAREGVSRCQDDKLVYILHNRGLFFRGVLRSTIFQFSFSSLLYICMCVYICMSYMQDVDLSEDY